MRLVDAVTGSAEFLSWGVYFRGLIDDRSWVSRRVETVTVLDRNRIERNISFDLDHARLQTGEAAPTDDGDYLLPVAILRKRLLLDLDVKDASGHAMSVVTSQGDSRAALSVMYAVLRGEFPALVVPPAASARLESLLRHESSRDFANLLYTLNPPKLVRRFQTFGRLHKLNLHDDERAFWLDILAKPQIRTVLFELVLSYMLIVRLPKVDSSNRIIKLRYVDQAVAFRIKVLQQLSIVSTRIPVPAGGIGFASREHTRVDAPYGTRIIDAELRSGRGGGRKVNPDLYERRISFDRAVIYTSQLERGNYLVWVKTLARSGTFTIPSILSTFLMACLAALILGLQSQHQNLDWLNGRSGSVVALLTLVPSLTVAYFARPGEHELIGRLLALPRIFVFAAALSVLSIAAGLALGDAAWVTNASTVAVCLNVVVLLLQMIGFVRVQAANLRRRDMHRFNDRRS